MIVVSDTTALTTLLKCGLEWVLPKLFATVAIPRAVEAELRAFHSSLPAWCVVHDVSRDSELDRLGSLVDAGEAEAIVLAIRLHADAVLLDDRKGRRHAEAMRLTCLALPAVLVAARRAGLIPSAAEAFELIATKGHYRVAESTAAVLLRSVGEA